MKKVFYDIIPNEKRTIRNIPLKRKTDSVLDSSMDSDKKSGQADYDNHQHTKIHHSVDGIRSTPHHDGGNKRSKEREIENEVEPEIVDEDLEASQILKSQKKSQKSIRDEDDGLDDEASFEQWRKTKKNSFWRAWVTLGVIAVLGVIVFSIFFGSATITINPVKHDLVLKETNIPINLIKHEEVSTEASASEEVEANGTVKIDRKATGKVILYNAFNSSTQRLVKGTRLETPNGLVYLLKSTVTIPGQKTVNGKKVPGSIEAEVEASESGEKYNQGFKDFNPLAYKGSDRYNTIYGRSKTALAGGFSGTVPNILTKDIESAVAKIKETIAKQVNEDFTKKARSKGDAFVYLPATKETTYSETKQEVSKNGKTATISIDAKAKAMLFDSTTLFEQIIKQQTEATTSTTTEADGTVIETEEGEIVYTGDFSKLNVSIEQDSIVSVSGTTTISSAIDLQKVTRAVSGLSKEQAIGAIKRLVELETIEIDIKPWWNKKLPSADKIEIKTEE